ncbi:MAG: DegQ family serine endoprotease [Desulfobacterales bacterium]
MNTAKKNRREMSWTKPLLFFSAMAISGFLICSGIAEAGTKTDDVQMIPESFSSIAANHTPAVINVRTVKNIKGGGRVFRHFSGRPFDRGMPGDDFFEKFFGGRPDRDFKQRSLGSGFIIDKDGYIVTNNHVVEDAEKIRVIMKDGKEFDAEMIGRDPSTDLALIKIKPEIDLPVLKFGSSSDLKVGEWVVAIGSPFGLAHTVTAGIVSAKGRVIGSGPYDDFIQTDASINPGNSGGPLLNMQGMVVGINTAIVAGGQGIGFAIPVDLAKGIINQLKKHGSVTRGWLGVVIQDLTEEIADYYGIKEVKGAFVMEVVPGDPADVAGIKPQDIIVEVNGNTVESSRDLTGVIANIGVGEKVEITVIRNGKKQTVKVKVGKRQDDVIASGKNEQRDSLGIRVADVTPETARRLDIQAERGVLVTNVGRGSKSEKAGVMVGDIIMEVNRTPVNNTREYDREIQKVKSGETIQLFIKRAESGFRVVKIVK